MAGADTNGHGLIHSIRQLAETVFAALENRVALATVELSEQGAYFLDLLFWMAVLFSLGALFILLFTATIVFLCAEELRLMVLAGFTLIYLGGALGAFFALRHRLKNRPAPFADTIAEIRKDRECLRAPKS